MFVCFLHLKYIKTTINTTSINQCLSKANTYEHAVQNNQVYAIHRLCENVFTYMCHAFSIFNRYVYLISKFATVLHVPPNVQVNQKEKSELFPNCISQFTKNVKNYVIQRNTEKLQSSAAYAYVPLPNFPVRAKPTAHYTIVQILVHLSLLFRITTNLFQIVDKRTTGLMSLYDSELTYLFLFQGSMKYPLTLGFS